MSPDAVTADRVYRELKRQIMVGELRPGNSLVLSQIAENAGTSVSPVRDAVLRMVGERLVDIQGGGGFALPALTSERLAHLYGWHADLLRIVIRSLDESTEIGDFPDDGSQGLSGEHHHLAKLAGDLFTRVGACSPNPEHLHAIIGIETRLHLIRIHEMVLPRCFSEIQSLWNIVRCGDKHSIRKALWHYHRRRLFNVDAIYSAMIKSGFIDR